MVNHAEACERVGAYVLRWVELALRTELAFSRMRRRAMFMAAASACRHPSCWCPAAFPPKACSTCFSAAARSSRRGSPRRRRTSLPIRSASIRSKPSLRRAARRRLRACFLRAQLRRQIFSADHARQRHAGSDVPGVLSRQRHQGVLRQQYRQRLRRQWRALCRQRKRLRLPQGAARRLHLQRPQPVGAGAGRSRARHLAALGRRRRHHRRPRGLYRRPPRRRPGRGIHAGRVLSRPHRRGPRPAR